MSSEQTRGAPFWLMLAALSTAVIPVRGHGDPPRARATAAVRDAPRTDRRWYDPVNERGQHARGLYFGGPFVRGSGAEAIIRTVRNARMNAAVIDLKDSEGRVHHDTAIPELSAHRTGWLGDTRALVRELREAGIYTIARIVCFADRRLPRDLPQRAILDVRERRGLWVSWGTGGTWLDPYHPENHRLVVELAREARELGFDEVQLDYVRFPVDDGTELARYPSETNETRTEVLMRLLRAVDEAIDIPLGVDVFGLAAYRTGDPSGLGQDLEEWTRHVEVFTPMLYPNSMRGWRRGEDNRAFRLVFGGTRRLRERVGAQPVIRPFLQAFANGPDEFGPGFIHQQILGARQAGADGFLFWHPGHSYSTVGRAMHARRSLVPFPIPDRVVETRQHR